MNYETLINPTLRGLRPSGIRKFFDIANEMEDVITLSIGEPDFSTPWHIRQEGIRSLEKGKTWYTANAGLLRLREAIAGYTMRHIGVAYEPKTEVLVTVGGSEAIDLCLRALVCAGDLAAVAHGLCNVFEEALALPEVAAIGQVMREHGTLGCRMTGSGSAVFGLFDNEEAARRCAAALRRDYDEVFQCRPCPHGPL